MNKKKIKNKTRADSFDELSPEHQKRVQGLIFSYATFLLAFFLGISSFTEKSQINSIVLGLILISLPAVVFLALIDFVVRTRQARKDSAIRGMAMLFTFAPSLFALGLFVWPFAAWATVIYFLSFFMWIFLFLEVSGSNVGPDSKI